MSSKLSTLLKEKMERESLSTRDVAKITGLSHMTVYRAARGDNLDIDTLQVLARFLGINFRELLDIEIAGESHLGQKLSYILSIYPELSETFSRVLDELDAGTLNLSDVRDIVDYAIYRITKRQSDRIHEGDR